ncbi:beta-ketoacyl synthase N-terminal-like domain-containing protein [Streptomyces sp. NPDC015684]|uniref:beta-ketoacyl synthase N-terminal-like domain-containing protein n=1 Tax=Streptomyces sp. NPDC015684 TaxID=3364963 RepID=UPI0036F4B813
MNPMERTDIDSHPGGGTSGPPPAPDPRPAGAEPGPADPVVVLVSAGDPARLARAARALHDRLAHLVRQERAPAAADVAWTTQTGRVPMRHRLAVVHPDLHGVLAGLGAFLAGRPDPAVHTGQAGPGVRAAAGSPVTAAEAARQWADGVDLPWQSYWRTRRSRVPLPVYPFTETETETEAGAGAGAEAQAASPSMSMTESESADATRPHAPDTARVPGTPEAAQAPDPAEPRVAALEDALLDRYAEVSGIPRDELDARTPFVEYGLTSLQIGELNALLAEDWGVGSRTLFFEHGDIAAVAADAVHRCGARRRTPEPAPETPRDPASRTLPAGAAHPAAGPDARPAVDGTGAIAVIGVAGRFPNSPDLETFWSRLATGHDCVTALPPERHRPGWPVDDMIGGFLDDVDRFDPLLFGITPRDASLMDPQERLFLETAWAALENAAHPRQRLRERHGSRVGVYAGAMYADYAFFGVEETLRGRPAYAGGALGNIANRVSYILDLHGPSLAVDTMCSSSLAALHLAVRALRAGDCEIALAGAVNLSLHPNKFVQQRLMSLTSSSRRCRSFGAGGDGFVPAEAVGVLVLKPLERALADGDRVRAVIRGSAVVHAGRTNGYLVPSPAAQGDVVRGALADAGLLPGDIDYLEAHGAGTALGDPVEIDGLGRVFGTGDRAAGSLPIGSVKSTIGHAEAAAGIAAFTKVLLQLEHRTLAPTLHADDLNPNIDWDTVPFRAQRTAAPWPRPTGPDGTPRPRRAGISSFGAGGTIAHLIVEEYPALSEPDTTAPRATGPGRPQLLVLSAYDEQRLKDSASRLAARLRAPGAPDLADVAWTLQVGREPLRERLALVVRDPAEASARLAEFAAGSATGADGVVRGRAPHGGRPQGRLLPDGPEADLGALARHWVAGGPVDWPLLHPREPETRPRVATLPAYPFARMRCWIPETAPGAPAVDAPAPAVAGPSRPVETVRAQAAAVGPVGSEQQPDGDALLLRREWLPTGEVSAGAGPAEGVVLCLYGTATRGLADALAASAPRGTLVPVLVGDDPGTPELRDETPTFADDEQADAVTGDLLARHPLIAGWIDLTDLDRTDPGDPGPWTARLLLVRRLLGARPGARLRGIQAVRGLQDLDGPAPDPSGARMAGFLRCLGAEYGRLDTTVVDTDLATADTDRLAASLWGEWHRPGARAEICHRHGLRYEPLLRPTLGRAVPFTPDPDRAYVVTGGTRGIGARVAAHLAERGAMAIAVLGGRPLPARHLWDAPEALGDAEAEAVENVRRLERLGARVLVHTGPLTDASALGAFLDRVRTELAPLGGVVHCAGGIGTGRPAFVGKDTASIRASFAPKADGLETLAALCAGDRLDFFVAFSSACALVPRLAVGVTDYAAANAAMDFLLAHRVRQGGAHFRSVCWPMWTDSGAARGKENVCAPVGLDTLNDTQGLRVLDQVLAMPWGGTVLPAVPLDPSFDAGTLLDSRACEAGGTAPAQPAAAVRPRPAPDAGRADASSAGADVSAAGAYVSSARADVSSAQSPTDGGPAWLVRLVCAVLGTPEADLDVTADFADLGVESVMLGELLDHVEEAVGERLPPSLLLEHPSVEQLHGHLTGLGLAPRHEAAPRTAPPADAPTASAPASPAVSAPPAHEPSHPAEVPAAAPRPAHGGTETKVAVIGMAGRFPGAPDVRTYWRNLLQGDCAVTEVPPGRWDTGALYSPDYAPGRSTGKWGGFLDGLERFDPEPFRLTDDEATVLDPGIRLFLEATRDCLADAGYRGEELRGRDVGVFVGGRISTYPRRAPLRPDVLQSDQNFLAAQVAHRFDFRGPNLVVDSACSSSLVSVQLACRSVLSGESELALAGGVEILLDERPYLEFSAARVLSPTGRCRPFDEQADGIVPGEACGAVLLKPLGAALRDGDPVHAVIEAVAVNNDGHTMGTTTPNPAAQTAVVRKALAAAGRRADEIGLVEAHGTATRIGDPMELKALTDAFAGAEEPYGRCAIGSVKANVGHLLSAAGVAGLIKVALSLEHGLVPPTLFCDTPNPRFDFAHSPFRPVTAVEEWAVPPERRVAGISSFGLGGTNAHLVASALDPRDRPAGVPVRRPLPAPEYRRRRLWLERDTAAPVHTGPAGAMPAPDPVSGGGTAPGSVSHAGTPDRTPDPGPAPVRAAILDLRFVTRQVTGEVSAPTPAAPVP